MKRIFAIFLILQIHSISYSQLHKVSTTTDTLYSLVGDTLKTNTGFEIIAGQKLLIGKGSDENGWYASMTFSSRFNWSLWLFHDMELDNSTNPNRVDAAWERERDKLKGFLYEGDSVLVRKIKRKGNKKHRYWYVAFIRDYKFPKTNFMCNIEMAIRTKEIIIESGISYL